jgi:multidrug efflux system membrane fusion protein
MGVRATLLSFAGLTIAVAGCQRAPAAKPSEVRPVVVLTATPSEVAQVQSYTGIVRARYEAELGFRVTGKIASRFVEVGQRVRAGEPIAALDPADYELAVKSAVAELGMAEAEARNAAAELARSEKAIAAGVASGSDLDSRRGSADSTRERVTKARRDLELARNRLAYCTLTSDTDGLVMALPVEAGQVVTAGQTVARVARSGSREAVVSIPEHRMEIAKAGSATVSLWSNSGVRHPIKLRELSPVADPATRTYQARFAISDDVPGVELGMTATVQLTTGGAEPVFVLPASALVRQGSQGAVWVVEKNTGRLTLTPVTVGRYGQDEVVLTTGLRGGELVVRAGVNKLDVGLTVRPMEGTR